MMDDETALIRRALDAAGYQHQPATAEALRDCFIDYIAAGAWADTWATMEDWEDEGLTLQEMCAGLINLR